MSQTVQQAADEVCRGRGMETAYALIELINVLGIDMTTEVSEVKRLVQAPGYSPPSLEMKIEDVPKGAKFWWDHDWFRLQEIRRHAKTRDDGTVWMLREGNHDVLQVDRNTKVFVDTRFS